MQSQICLNGYKLQAFHFGVKPASNLDQIGSASKTLKHAYEEQLSNQRVSCQLEYDAQLGEYIKTAVLYVD